MARIAQRVSPVRRGGGRAQAIPPHAYFLVSAVFHYLGPAFAVLLFAHLYVLGVAWLRIATGALVFALWRRPWRIVARSSWPQRRLLLALGALFCIMNVCFYLAIDRLPLGTVGAIEFLGSMTLAALGIRTIRNLSALALTVCGVGLLTHVRLAGEPLGFLFAFGSAGLFMVYVILGHRIARDGGAQGIDRLGAAMLIALLGMTPIGLAQAAPALTHPSLLFAGIGVGICSAVIPFVCDQLAMARLPRATFALLLALLPATATVIGIVVLRQVPSIIEVLGVGLVVCGVAVHQEAP